MFPPQSNATLDIEALPDIFGSISVACWIFVFTPQIYKNWKRSSTDGLATSFLVVWTAGDICNVVGAIFQNVLPTMIILALYYILADIALLYQVWAYGGNSSKDAAKSSVSASSDCERQPLLAATSPAGIEDSPKKSYFERLKRQFRHPEHLSPATPLIDERYERARPVVEKPRTLLQELTFNTFMILLVVAAGMSGWYISGMMKRRDHEHRHKHHHQHHRYDKANDDDSDAGGPLEFDYIGQVFGYLCAALYLGSRIPQILTNYRRKSTEALSLLFIMYACLGNITYDMSIFTYSPDKYCADGPGRCEAGEALSIYRKYLAINASWIVGSLGALLLDLIVFSQCLLYRTDDASNDTGTENHHIVAGDRSRDD